MCNKRVVRTVLGSILKKQYPNGHQAITPIELLKWPLWPTYFKIHVSFRHQDSASSTQMLSQSASCRDPIGALSDEDYLCTICSYAMEVLAQICHEIISGDISIQQLHEIEKEMEKLFKLCEAVSSVSDQQLFAVDGVTAAMEKHKSEYYRLTKRVQQLRTLFFNVPHLKIGSELFT